MARREKIVSPLVQNSSGGLDAEGFTWSPLGLTRRNHFLFFLVHFLRASGHLWSLAQPPVEAKA